MYYEFECPDCGSRRTVQRKVDDRHLPEFCIHSNKDLRGEPVSYSGCVSKMRRVVSRFQAITDRECDRPENQLGRIRTRSTSRKDWLEVEKRDIATQERRAAKYEQNAPQEKYTSVGDILATGLRPDMTKEAVQNWRKVNIPKDDFATVSGD